MALIPMRYAFQPVAACRRLTSSEPFAVLSPKHLIPDWFPDEDAAPFATFYAGWTRDALHFGAQANLRRQPRAFPSRWWDGDCVELFLELRGAFPRDRYTEHCVHLFFLPAGVGNLRAVAGRCEPAVEHQVAIPNDSTVRIASETFPQGFKLDATLSHDAIPTYDPVKYRRIGFNYQIREAGGRAQYWSAGPEIRAHRDPSAWGALDLVD